MRSLLVFILLMVFVIGAILSFIQVSISGAILGMVFVISAISMTKLSNGS